MAGDQGIVNAYLRRDQAAAQAKLMNDPFYIFTELAGQAAQEWVHEKKLDTARAKKKGQIWGDNAEEILGTSLGGWNQDTKTLAYDHLEMKTEEYNQAAIADDKQKMRQITEDIQGFETQLNQGQNIMAEHAKSLEAGTYSAGTGTATLNKFLAGDPEDYQTFMETDPAKPVDGKLHVRIMGNDSVVTGISVDDLAKGNVQRADAFGDAYKKPLTIW